MKPSVITILPLVLIVLLTKPLPSTSHPHYYRHRLHDFGGHFAVANRNSGTISLVHPETLRPSFTYTLPNNGSPMYFGYYQPRAELWVGDRENSRIVVTKLRGSYLKTSRFLPAAEGVFHTMPSQVDMGGHDENQVVCTTCDIANVTVIHNPRTQERLADIPLPPLIKKLGGVPHDTTNNGQYGFVTYIKNSGDFDYVASYACSSDKRRWRLIKLLRTAKDPHIAVRGDTNLVIAAQGGEVLFVTIPDLKIISRDNNQPSPHGTIISFDLNNLYITNIAEKGKKAIVTYDMRNGARKKECDIVDTTNTVPHNPAVSLDGRRLFVSHSGAESKVCSAFDLDERGCPIQKSERVFETGLNPFGVFIIPKAPRTRRVGYPWKGKDWWGDWWERDWE